MAKKTAASEGVTYDKYGRMNYHPDIHGKQKTSWTTTDQKYLIESYEFLGPEQVSFALERTIHTVMTRAYELRKQGLMKKASKRAYHKRSSLDLSASPLPPVMPALFTNPLTH